MRLKIYTKEIQYRFTFIFINLIFNLIILYYYKEKIIFLLGQHQNSFFPYFITTNLPETFFCLLKLCIYLAFFFCFPLVIIQTWLFIIPALYVKEYKVAKLLICSLILLYILTNYATYKILLPYCWDFFSGFELNYEKDGINIQLEAKLSDYLSFVTKIVMILNICLNSCLIIGFLLLKLSLEVVTKLRKIIYFLSFGIATIVTPPDIFSQILIGLVLIFLYETVVIFLFLTKEYKKGE